jgi:hypothetical protein
MVLHRIALCMCFVDGQRPLVLLDTHTRPAVAFAPPAPVFVHGMTRRGTGQFLLPGGGHLEHGVVLRGSTVTCANLSVLFEASLPASPRLACPPACPDFFPTCLAVLCRAQSGAAMGPGSRQRMQAACWGLADLASSNPRQEHPPQPSRPPAVRCCTLQVNIWADSMEEALERCMAALDGVRQQLVKEQMLQTADSPVPPALLVLPPCGGTGTGKPAASAPDAAPPLWQLGGASFGRKLGYWGLRQAAGRSFFDVSHEGPLLAIQCRVLLQEVEQQLQPAAAYWAGLPEERRQAIRAMADSLDEQISWLDRARKAVPQPTAQQWVAWHAKHPEGIMRGAPHAPALATLMLEVILPKLQQQGQGQGQQQLLLHDSLEAARELGAARLSTQQAERLQWLRALVSSAGEFAPLLDELAAAQAEPDSDTSRRQQQQIAGKAIRFVDPAYYKLLDSVWKKISAARGGKVGGPVDTISKQPDEPSKWKKGGINGGAVARATGVPCCTVPRCGAPCKALLCAVWRAAQLCLLPLPTLTAPPTCYALLQGRG